MGKRIFSTFALWAVAAIAIIYGKSVGFSLIICALALGANYEVCALLRGAGMSPMLKYVQVATVLMFAAATLPFGVASGFAGVVAAGLVVMPLFTLVKDPFGRFFADSVLPTVAVLFTVPFMLRYYVLIAAVGAGYESVMLAVWIIAAAKFSDVGAYVVGCAFGRHKMSPSISPNKTWEGAVGGVVSAAAAGAIIAWLGAKYGIFYEHISPAMAAAVSMPVGVVAIVSDLLESVFKRRMNVKDSGAIIPGIGGMLDLADSLILCAPLAYFMVSVLAVTGFLCCGRC